MLELGKKEHHLMGGHLVLILVVVPMVFAYTQAIRQVKLSRDLSVRLQEQLTISQEQVARQGGKVDTANLQAQVAELKSSLIPQNALEIQARRLEKLAQERFGIRDAQVKTGNVPSGKFSAPLEGQPDFEVHLYTLEMKGMADSRSVAGLLSSVSDPSFRPLCPLIAMELKSAESAENRPVEFTLKWLMAVSPDSSSSPVAETLPQSGHPPAWGWREEPFLSALIHPSALRVPAEKLSLFHLAGIVQQGTSGLTCIINGEVLKLGGWIKGYQVVLITRNAVLLEGKGEELTLFLP